MKKIDQQKWIQLSLSIWLVYHLTVILVSPNPDSILHRIISPAISGYGNFLGVNNTWRFFSPNPHMRVVEYEARLFNAAGDIELEETHRIPEGLEQAGSRESYNRIMNFAMMTSGAPNLLNDILKPLLCKMHPWASEIAVFQIYREFPNIEMARMLTGDRDDLSEIQRVSVQDLECKPTGEQ